MSTFVGAFISGLFLGATYALVACGLTIIYGLLNILNFAYGALLLLAAYLAVRFLGHGIDFWISLLLGVLLVVLLGVVLERLLFRRVASEHIAGLIVSVGIISVVDAVILQFWGPGSYSLPQFINGYVSILGSVVTKNRLLILFVTAMILAGTQLGVKRSRWGKALRATGIDREAALLQGIPVRKVIVGGFAFGTALGATAGVVLGTALQVQPELGQNLLLDAFIIIIIGGPGSIPGALLGSLIYGMAEALGAVYLPVAAAELLPLVALMIVLLVRPQGILGRITTRV